jgi:2-polyprenyl-6-methoxyphenol hydroxylase-like FAD-dependent oxidoreductase
VQRHRWAPVTLADHSDVLIVGGGHNGLVAAAYLGRAGRRVTLLEARTTLVLQP